jgi:hypothetical protein
MYISIILYHGGAVFNCEYYLLYMHLPFMTTPFYFTFDTLSFSFFEEIGDSTSPSTLQVLLGKYMYRRLVHIFATCIDTCILLDRRMVPKLIPV